MDSLKSIPLPPTSTIPLPQDKEPKLVITSSTSGERSVSTIDDASAAKTPHKEKKKHKKEKHKHKHKHKEKDKEKSKDKKKKDHPLITPQVLSQHASAIKAAMLKEVQSDSSNAELSQTIVDDLFKDFLASKMNEIESAYKQAAEKKDGQGEVVNSVEEMNKLLDDELDSISQNTPSPIKKTTTMTTATSSSQNTKQNNGASLKSLVKPKEVSSVVMYPLTAEEASKSKREKKLKSEIVLSQNKLGCGQEKQEIKQRSEKDKKDSGSVDTNKQSFSLEASKPIVSLEASKPIVSLDLEAIKPSVPNIESNKQSVFALTSFPSIAAETSKPSIPEETSKQNVVSMEKNKPGISVESKKPGKLQLALKISQTSAELISSGSKLDEKKKALEEGEVLSSGHATSSDSDSPDEGIDDIDDDADISETGSLSDSDKDSKDKSKKKKKKKKHKKKKKKHKIAKDKEKEELENKSKRKYSHRSRSKSPKKHRKSKSPSKDGKKRSRSKSFSPEHGVWREARSRSREKKKKERSKSFSPDRGIWKSSKHKLDIDKSRERDTEDRKHDHDRDYDKHRRHDRNRDFDRHKYDRDYDRDRRRSREREYDKRDSERRYGKWRSRSRSRERKHDKGKSNEDLRLKIDKAKLREIAMKNALAMAKSGQAGIPGIDFASIKAGGKSVEELTEFCARIAAKEKLKNRPAGLTSSSSSDDDDKKSDDDELIHHPFKVTDKAITLNIRNATQLPILSAQEKITQQATLRLQFPVSSGNVHRTKEIEWVPVEKTETVKTSAVASTTTIAPVVAIPSGTSTTTTTTPTVATEVKLMPVKEEDKVFVEPPQEHVDISSIISERIKAARKLAENPRDSEAMSAMQKAQRNASLWANSKNLPGKFIGSTGAQILSQDELMGPDKKRQAWAKKAIAEVTRYRRYRKKFTTDVVKKLVLKSLAIVDIKDQFNRAAPVKGGIGMALLQKMGWQQGTGLGKNNEGKLEPLALDFKMDRKGLTSHDEHRPSKRLPTPQGLPLRKDLSGKHPVSALVELCNKRKWGSPDFQIVNEAGPDHKKSFLFKVIVNGTEYQPSSASQNKKHAKAQAATAVLQEMGLLPRHT